MSRDEEKYRVIRDRDRRILGYRPTRAEVVLLAEWLSSHGHVAVIIQQRASLKDEYRNLARLAFFEP